MSRRWLAPAGAAGPAFEGVTLPGAVCRRPRAAPEQEVARWPPAACGSSHAGSTSGTFSLVGTSVLAGVSSSSFALRRWLQGLGRGSPTGTNFLAPRLRWDMRLKVSGVWVLVTVLLTCPFLASKPRGAGNGATLHAVDAPAVPAARPSDAVPRALPALKTRSPLDRQWTSWDVALAAATPRGIFTGSLSPGTASQWASHPARRSARNFPPFPTGPPLEN